MVVTEHRGLNLDARGWAAQAEDVIIVMVYPNPFICIFSKLISPKTGGYPSMATREFLNFLARTKPADKVPFIYVSNHDVGGWQIYRTLRYGSAKVAWLSVSQSVPKLEWSGITTRQYIDLVDAMKDLKLKEFAETNKDWDHEKCENEVSNWIQQRKVSFNHVCSSTIPECDLTRLVNLRQLLSIEPRLGQEIKQMIETKKGGFGCSMLNEIRSGGQELF